MTGHHAGLELAVRTNSRKNQPRTNSRANARTTTVIQTPMLIAGILAACWETSCTRRACVDQADCGWAWSGRWICAGAKRAAVRPEAGRTEVS